MTSPSTSWLPAQGRYQVNIGSSFGRALKARRLQGSAQAVNTKRSHLPDRDFYSFRYNFKPGTLDANRPGTIEAQADPVMTAITLEQHSTVDTSVVFKGTETPAKELDCVLIYDEDTGTYTLEKLDSCISLKFQRQSTSVPAPPPSPPLMPSPAPKVPVRAVDYDADDLERSLLELAEEDAEGEVDDDLEEVTHSATFAREEEEEEEIFIPPRPPSPKPQLPPPKPTRAVKPLPKSRVQAQAPVAAPVVAPAPVVPPPPKPRPVQAKRRNSKREPEPVIVMSEPEEEELSFGKPAIPARPSPPTAAASSSSAWALPGSSSSFASLPSAAKPVASSSHALPPPPPPAAVDSDDDEDWDEVQPTVVSEGGAHDDIFGDDSEARDIDFNDLENELEAELNQELESDEDFLAAAVAEDSEPPPVTGQPISLKQLAGGGDASEDEYSSSDDSDDD